MRNTRVCFSLILRHPVYTRKKDRERERERGREREETAKVQPKRREARCSRTRGTAAVRGGHQRLWTDQRSLSRCCGRHRFFSFSFPSLFSVPTAGEWCLTPHAPGFHGDLSCTPRRDYGRVRSSVHVVAASHAAVCGANLVCQRRGSWNVLGAVGARSRASGRTADGRARRCNGWRESTGRCAPRERAFPAGTCEHVRREFVFLTGKPRDVKVAENAL